MGGHRWGQLDRAELPVCLGPPSMAPSGEEHLGMRAPQLDRVAGLWGSPCPCTSACQGENWPRDGCRKGLAASETHRCPALWPIPGAGPRHPVALESQEISRQLHVVGVRPEDPLEAVVSGGGATAWHPPARPLQTLKPLLHMAERLGEGPPCLPL